MKTKNLYYATVFGRTNMLRDLILRFFIMIASWPRMVLEVFIRTNFGERYFSLATAITLIVVLGFLPYQMAQSFFGYYGLTFFEYIKLNPLWYLFVVAFGYFSWKRYQEVKRKPGVFDFAKFTWSTGEKNRKFYDLKWFGQDPSGRVISTIYEPAFFLAIGIFLIICHQSLGYLITVCSICYSLGYAGQYHLGDMFVMDKIDEMICNEELVESFVNNRPSHKTKGFEAYGHRPTNEDFRRKVYKTFFEDEPMASEVF